MKKVVLDILKRIRSLPRRFKKALQRRLIARGYGKWKKLIHNERDFMVAISGALDRLLAVESKDTLGDYLEFGVSRGTSMACVHHVLRERGLDRMRQIGFDSFQGLPPEAAKEGWVPGRYASTTRATRHYLKANGVDLKQVTLVKGWFSDTLNERTRAQFGIKKASVLMLDCDIYAATKEALAFALPLVRKRAVLIFDDWGWRSDRNMIGQREAYEECVIAPGLFSVEPLRGYIPQSRLFLISRRSLGADWPAQQ